MKKTLLFFIVLICSLRIYAQESHRDSTLKNTIRVNITPILVTSTIKSFTMGYERVIKPHFSVSANLGHLQLPTIISLPSSAPIEWRKSRRNTGFLFSTDLRFYFKRNRYTAPDGLYWGPYASYYKFINKADIHIKDNNVLEGDATLTTNFGILMLGAQMGYQFVLGKHWTIDLIFIGPGVGFYNASIKLDGDISADKDSEYIKELYDAIVDRFPGANTLLQNHEIRESGSKRFTSLGFRYLVQIGFRF